MCFLEWEEGTDEMLNAFTFVWLIDCGTEWKRDRREKEEEWGESRDYNYFIPKQQKEREGERDT